MFQIDEELKKLPSKPGVYIMYDKNDIIIYVGKAKILKNRVRQYFQKSANHSIKVLTMVKNIVRFEYIVTETEIEALILENNLIKENTPKYNIRLKDDKTYPYIKLTTNEMFPRIIITRKHEKDKAKYFGPFTSADMVKENIEVILNVFPLRRCKRVFPRDLGKERPCLNYHIGKCLAPCNYKISEEDYSKIVDDVIEFLNGNHSKILKKLQQEMEDASDNLKFEKAGEIRDKIIAVKNLKERQIVENMNLDDRDVIGMSRAFDEAVFKMFFIRGGKITGNEHFIIDNCEGSTRKEIINNFIKQFYSGTPFIPKEILIQEEIEDKDIISCWLSEIKGQKVNLICPKKGEKQKLVELAQKNSIIILDKYAEDLKREERRTIGALNELKNAIGENISLNRIEAYDISNTQGFQSVGSMVVFENGKPKRSDYRKFKIKTVVVSNDYASMEEVIHRRFMRYLKEKEELNENDYGKFNKLPDAIFLDGGKGQVSVVEKILNNLKINVKIFGMVKDNNHRTRGLIYKNQEIFINNHSEGFKLLTRIQDEVHRFAIDYHRKLRQNVQVKSILDDIDGIGDTRRRNLLKYFGNIDEIKKAEVSELLKVDGMNVKSSEAVYNFFHKI